MKGLEALLRSTLVPVIRRIPDKTLRQIALRYYVEGGAKRAIEVMKFFRQRGINPIFDILGEGACDLSLAQENKQAYLLLMQEIASERQQEKSLHLNYFPEISIKLSMLGLPPFCFNDSVCIDEQFLFVQNQVIEILDEAQRQNIFVRIDMEDSGYTDNTLLMYKNLRQKGFDNVGVVLQSRLKRTNIDLDGLISFGPNIRLVKGAYHNEPKNKTYTKRRDVDKKFLDLESKILSYDLPIEIATMDDYIIEASLDIISTYAEDNGHEPDYCFSMLYGARDQKLFELAREGIPSKMYIPYGPWQKAKAYALRRFYENPLLAIEILKNEIKKLDL